MIILYYNGISVSIYTHDDAKIKFLNLNFPLSRDDGER